TNRDEEKSVLDRKNPRKSRKEKNWQNKAHPVNTWRENDAILVRESQLKDTDLKAIIELLENRPYELRKNSLDGYFLKEGVLYSSEDSENECLVVPKDERQQLLWEHHNAPTGGHFGWKKMSLILKKQYFWPFMTREIKIYCQMCKACAARSGQERRPHPHLMPIPITDEPME
ncbi:MAG: hypothetical protein GY820_27980, partial [Gammaproteobacteria bacterium]|nr:hypothetical protein [Gammaproteobacteria bacterium]